MRAELDADGIEVVEGFVPGVVLEGIESTLPVVDGAGVRGIARLSLQVAEFAYAATTIRLIRNVLGEHARLVRSILFDKSPDASWTLGLHRDLTIAMRDRIDTPGFGPWSAKQGVHHVQPARSVLEAMVTLRLHFDDADETNGCLLVMPASQNSKGAAGGALRDAHPIVVQRGDAVLMRPLLLHGSGPNRSQRCRRVLHLEYAAAELPGALRWAEGGA